MKIYNPFKPHIIECKNKFFIRRFNYKYLSYEFLDKENNHLWWDINEPVNKYCQFEELKEAGKRLEIYKKALQNVKNRKEKYKKCKYVKS